MAKAGLMRWPAVLEARLLQSSRTASRIPPSGGYGSYTTWTGIRQNAVMAGSRGTPGLLDPREKSGTTCRGTAATRLPAGPPHATLQSRQCRTAHYGKAKTNSA